MRAASEFDNGCISAEERLDIGQVFADRDFVALPFVPLVPLIMIVKNERNEIVEPVDEPVGDGGIDKTMKSAVQLREVVVTGVDLAQEREMLPAEGLNLAPKAASLPVAPKRRVLIASSTRPATGRPWKRDSISSPMAGS